MTKLLGRGMHAPEMRRTSMKTILGCMAVFTAMIFVFSCSGKKSFDKSEDFETGKFTDTLFGPGASGTTVWVVSAPERVISGKFSAYSKAEPYRGEWWEFLYSDREKSPLERKRSYRVTFKYKAVEAPGPDGFYYFVVKTKTGFDRDKNFADDRGFTKWADTGGAVGIKTIGFTLGDFDDYYLVWGIHSQGGLSIDDIRITKLSGRKIFEEDEDFESGDFGGTLFGPAGGGGQIVSDAQKVVNGKFSAYGKADPSKSEWSEFLYSDKKKLPLERNGSYTVAFTYKAVEAPSPNGFYYFVVRSNAGGIANDKAFTKWSDVADAGGTKTIEITLGDFDDYYLIWGIHSQGAVAIDDIKVTKSK